MKYCLITLALLMALRASAQLSVGNEGITIAAGSSFSVDGLTLAPSANLTLTNNTIQRTTTPITGSPSITRLYQFGTPVLFSGTVGINYLTTELNGYTEFTLQVAYASAANTPLTVTTGSTVNSTAHSVSKALTNQNLFVVTATALSDLTPTLYARPLTLFGTTNFGLVVDVTEINLVPTSRPTRVFITKDPLINLSFNGALTTLNDQPVQNNVWSFDGTSNSSFYILTTNQVIAGGTILSFGLNGVINPAGTAGTLSVSSSVVGTSAVEAKITNNSDADRLTYFAQ